MTIKYLNYFSGVLIVTLLLMTPMRSKAEQLDSTWYSYCFGAGVSATLCDQVEVGLITNLEARMFTSNFEKKFRR